MVVFIKWISFSIKPNVYKTSDGWFPISKYTVWCQRAAQPKQSRRMKLLVLVLLCSSQVDVGLGRSGYDLLINFLGKTLQPLDNHDYDYTDNMYWTYILITFLFAHRMFPSLPQLSRKCQRLSLTQKGNSRQEF